MNLVRFSVLTVSVLERNTAVQTAYGSYQAWVVCSEGNDKVIAFYKTGSQN